MAGKGDGGEAPGVGGGGGGGEGAWCGGAPTGAVYTSFNWPGLVEPSVRPEPSALSPGQLKFEEQNQKKNETFTSTFQFISKKSFEK